MLCFGILRFSTGLNGYIYIYPLYPVESLNLLLVYDIKSMQINKIEMSVCNLEVTLCTKFIVKYLR